MFSLDFLFRLKKDRDDFKGWFEIFLNNVILVM